MRWSLNAISWVLGLALAIAALGVAGHLGQAGKQWSDSSHQRHCTSTVWAGLDSDACESLARAQLSGEKSSVQSWFRTDNFLLVPLYLTAFVLLAYASATSLFAPGTKVRVVALTVLIGMTLLAAIADWHENMSALSLLEEQTSPPSLADVEQLGAAIVLKWRMLTLAFSLTLLSVVAAAFVRVTSLTFRSWLRQKVPGRK